MNEQINKEKINYFYAKGEKVHVKLNNKEFRNGVILEQSALFFILRELNGLETPVFFSEIFDVGPYQEKEKDE